ncbi:RHS repeat-associated core domain-containing protein [Acinetobacter sp. V102_4]|nr:RHS repeat-associated core domain-containing protein [Acinetobacter sp. V102_4]MDS7928648.1 RHS repeat-associated core domain-containing protein [Acinetobacter sp. V102_4]
MDFWIRQYLVYNQTGSITFNLLFPGQYYDVGTNRFYNHNRFYNPELGRYMELDPIGFEGGLNPYVYADSNPVMKVDPSGLELISMLCNINKVLMFLKLGYFYSVNKINIYDFQYVTNSPFSSYNIEQQGDFAVGIFRGKLPNIIKNRGAGGSW